VRVRPEGQEEKTISTKRCSKCLKPTVDYAKQEKTRAQLEEEKVVDDKRILELLDGLRPREKKKIERKL